MSLLNKVKNFFYEEVEVDEEEEARKEEEKRRLKEQKREERRKASIEKIEKMKQERALKEEKKRVEQELQRTVEVERPKPIQNEDLTERELFKSERTFNFPMDLGDDIFDEEPKREEVAVKPKVEERKTTYVSPTTVRRYENISRQKVEEVKEEPHKFRPTPVISPIYGILDKNYSVDDVKEKSLDKTKEFSIEKRIVDFDSVRNRAYKELDEEIEKTLTDSKDIFYNLDSEEPAASNDISDYEEEPHNAEEDKDVVITYEDIPEEPSFEEAKEVEIQEKPIEEEDDDFEMPTPDIEIPKKTTKAKKTRRSKKVEVEEEAETTEDSKEDLFNLIDNMYSGDDEEDED